ncbi:MAG: hypothetical protein KAT48_13390 [Bacteroidales bacterium]|nr:hypothetical protein [Bacteroidales bacterium]
MKNEVNKQEDLKHKDNVRLIIDYIHRTLMHHMMWYGEVQHQFGREKALEALQTVYKKSYDIQMKRLSKALGFEMNDNLPKPLLNLSDEQLQSLKESLAVNWLVNDGVWFQAVEFSRDMNDAKRCNDSCWGQFSPFEAWSIKQFLGLPENSGLDGLKRALNFRLYATVNKQSIVEETPSGFVFQMNNCRVQAARKRKGLDDYPCKSGGLVEYTTFVEAIDSRIKTECIACPPDKHPDDWYCAWKFSLNEGNKQNTAPIK